MRQAVDDRLEVIVPEGWVEPAAAPKPRRDIRITPKWVALFAGMVVAAAAFTVYAVMAVTSIRELERIRDRAAQISAERQALSNRLLASVVSQEDTAVVAEATRGLLLEHRERLIALADEADGVGAIDPGVRSLRRALVGALMRDAHDLEHASRAPVPPASPALGRGFPYADRLLDKERRQWRLGKGDVPDPPAHLQAADAAFVKLATWTDQKTGARLVVLDEAGLRVLDLDSSTATAMEFQDGVGSVAAGPDFLAVTGGRDVFVLDPGDDFTRRQSTDGRLVDRTLVPAASGGGLWAQEVGPALGPAVRLDTSARPTGESVSPYGHLVADLGPTMLWEVSPVDSDPLVRRGSFILSDKQTDRVITRYDGRELFATSAAGVAWRVDSEHLEVTDPIGRVRAVPQRDELFPRSAAFSPDGRRLAVGWGNGVLDIVELTEGAVVHSVRTAGPSVIRWTPSGSHVFFSTGTGLAFYRLGDADAHRLRLRMTAGLLVAAF